MVIDIIATVFESIAILFGLIGLIETLKIKQTNKGDITTAIVYIMLLVAPILGLFAIWY